MKKYSLGWLLGAVVVLGACTQKQGSKNSEVSIERFDVEMMAVTSEEELRGLLNRNSAIADLLFEVAPNDTGLVSDLFHMVRHEDARRLFQQTQQTFGDLSVLERSFSTAFNEIKRLYPEFKAPRIVAGFSGLRNDLAVTDSLVVISLESFIGPEALYRPDQPDYVLSRYAPDYIVPNVIRFLSNQFNKLDFSRDSFLQDLVFFGKSLEFGRAVLPHIEDSLIIGYSNREMQNAYENQDYIWAHVIERQLLNSENPAVNAKYFAERPYVAEISGDCPGRIGQWLGWRIVERYRIENPKVSLQELMANDDAEAILRGSKYRGQQD